MKFSMGAGKPAATSNPKWIQLILDSNKKDDAPVECMNECCKEKK